MPDYSYTAEFFREHGVSRVNAIIRNPLDTRRLYVFVEVERNEKNLQVPSNAQLHRLRLELSKNGQEIDFVLIDASSKDSEAGIRATMLHHFGDKIRNSFMSIDGRSADIWIVPKTKVSPDELAAAEQKASAFLDNVGLKLRRISLISDDNTPTKSACLAIIRTSSPADITFIIESARSRGFVVPSVDWMSRMLDNLRKAGLIVRFKNGHYALSLAGLKAGGTAKNSSSPDVRRILDLARRAR